MGQLRLRVGVVLVALGLMPAGEVSAGAQQHPNPQAAQPDSAVARARSSLREGDVSTAIQTLNAYLGGHPRDTAARLLLADSYLAAQQGQQAEAEYQTILESEPNNLLALAGLAQVYERAGNPERAEPILARAAKIGTRDQKIRSAWAAVLARLHRYREASSALAGVDPPRLPQERISFYRLKAAIAAGLGDSASAATEMEKALALAPDQPDLQIATARIQLQARHWKRAGDLSGKLFARTGDPQLGLMLLEAQLAGGQDFRATLDSFDRLTLSPEQEADLRERLADLLITHGQFAESADQLKRAIQLHPGRTNLSFNLALVQFKGGHLDEALATAEGLRKAADSAEVQDLMGDIEEARGDYLAAARSYEDAIRLAPDEEQYRLSLALELMRHSNFEAARVVLKQAEELHPESWRLRLALGTLEYLAGSPENATKTLLDAAQLAPDPEPALSYLGQIQLDQSGKPDSAALAGICQYADLHPGAAKIQFYCAALQFHRDYAAQDRSHVDRILLRLNSAAKMLPSEPAPHCQLGRLYRWIERWPEALRESETCARLDPNSADAHYRLAQIYQHLGDRQRSEEQMKLHEAASARLADENARRDETIKTFLYSIQSDAQSRK